MFTSMVTPLIEMAGITTSNLRPGEWRYLTEDEVASLRNLVGLA